MGAFFLRASRAVRTAVCSHQHWFPPISLVGCSMLPALKDSAGKQTASSMSLSGRQGLGLTQPQVFQLHKPVHPARLAQG